MGQTRAVDQVADGVDAGQVCLHLIIDAHATAIVVEALLHQLLQAARIGTATNRHQHVLGVEALLALLRLRDDLLLLTIVRNGFYARVSDDLDAAFRQNPDQQTPYLLVERCQHGGQHLQNRDLCAQRVEHARQLGTDHAAADADQALGQLGQVPAGVAIHNILAIDTGHIGNERNRAIRQNDLVGGELLFVAAFFRNGHFAGRVDGTQAIKYVDVVRLHQRADAARHALDDFVLEDDCFTHIKGRRLWQMDAQVVYRFQIVQHLCDVQHCFGRDAADIEAGSAKILFLYNRGLCAELRRAYGRDIAARTRADDRDIIMITCHKFLLKPLWLFSNYPQYITFLATMADEQGKMEDRVNGGASGCHLVC